MGCKMNLDQDTLDSRDLEERIIELEKDNNLTDEEKEEYNQLIAIKNDCEDYGWEHGIYFISEYYWVTYCEDFAYDCGYMETFKSNNGYNPLSYCVDWEKWADQVKMDYSSITFNNRDYYWREA
tara:strand:- start:410 stop:781 length:372 start_codon:yes stop_codon:yes gene_type:complete